MTKAFKIVVGSLLIAMVALTNCTTYPRTPITNEMMNEAYVDKFLKMYCAYNWEDREMQTKERREECTQKWGRAFASRIKQAYPHADLALLIRECDDYPDACSPNTMEIWAQKSDAERQKSGK